MSKRGDEKVRWILVKLGTLDQIQFNLRETPMLNAEEIKRKRHKPNESLSRTLEKCKEDGAIVERIKRLKKSYEEERTELIER